MVDRLVVAGLAGLRWAVAQPLPDDDVYAGAAGVLRALAEAHMGGHRAFDKVALELRDRLIAAPLGAEPGLYVGTAGHVAALAAWAAASGDATAAASAAEHARRLAAGPVQTSRDVINGQAGLLLVLVAAGERDGAARVADALATAAEPAPGGVQWRHTATATYLMPGLSHGTAGVVLALARAAGLLDRRDLLALARAGGQQLLVLGRRDDGTVALPLTVPPQPAPPHQGWGWCHGPTGTVQAFLALDAHDLAWQPAVDAALAALRASGVPERRYPGFWDNVAQCCGTAGVLDLALDRYQASTDPDWLSWAGVLADDLLTHAVPVDGADDAALTWSNVEHRRPDPVLPPEPGWMQGTAGVAAALLRTARLRRDGPAAARVPWPDRA